MSKATGFWECQIIPTEVLLFLTVRPGGQFIPNMSLCTSRISKSWCFSEEWDLGTGWCLHAVGIPCSAQIFGGQLSYVQDIEVNLCPSSICSFFSCNRKVHVTVIAVNNSEQLSSCSGGVCSNRWWPSNKSPSEDKSGRSPLLPCQLLNRWHRLRTALHSQNINCVLSILI